MSSPSSVKVAVRLRPMNKTEEVQGTLPVVNASSVDNTITAIKGNGRGQQRSSFSFDNVFSSYTTQEQVFEATLKPVILDVLQGFESTVFAYGQTGTGKTHTMEGDLSDPDSYGVIPRSAESIFEVLNRPEYVAHNVVVSYLEIYNEELCDLLSGDEFGHRSSKKMCKLEIMEGKDGVICRGLTELQVKSPADVLEVMKKAQQFRKIGETKMNKQSSRSHCVFTLRLTAKKQLNDGNVFDTRGKLHLVDLAGSECAKSASFASSPKRLSSSVRSHEGRDEVSRERGRERSNINRSLLTLGRVIIMLKEQSQSKKSSHMRIPYRDSKLTRILQDSLGGKCKTQIIATVSPSVLSIEETMSTLSYAQTASGIVNKPVAVSYISVGVNGSRVSTATSEMTDVRSVEHWQEMEMRMEYLQSQVEEAQAALARQYREQKGIIDRAEKAEEDLMHTEQKLRISEHNFKKSNRILEATKETERRLTSEATDLMKKLDVSIADGNELHNLLAQSRDADFKRKEATKNFHTAVLEKVSLIMGKLGNLDEEGDKYHSKTVDDAGERQTQEHEELNQSVQLLHEIQLHVSDLTMTMKSHVQDENGMMDILSILSDDVQKGIKEAKKYVNDGEEALETCIDNARRDLKTHSEQLLEMEQKYNTTSDDYVKLMKTLIGQSSDKVETMVTSAVEALMQARDDSSKTRESLSETLATFHTVSAKSVARIQEESMITSKRLTKSLDSFVDGMKHIDDIEEQLEKQQNTISTEGGAHLMEIQEQKNLVIAQQDALGAAKSAQRVLEQDFVKQVIQGVTELVNEQMNLMSSKHEDRLVMLEKRNDSLNALTDGVQSSAKNIFHEINAANESINEHANETRLNDEAIKNTAEYTDAVLSNIEKISSNQKEVETGFFDQTNENAGKLADHELAITAASSNLKTNSSDVAVFLTENMQGDMASGLSTLSNLANKHAEYSRDSVVLSTDNQLEKIAEPRADVITNFSKASDSVLRSVVDGREKIEVVASKQCDTADDLRSDVENKFDNFANNVAKLRRSIIDTKKRVTIESSDDFNKLSKDTLSSAVTYASTTREDVNDYTTNTINYQEEVPPISDRKKIEYNTKLSSTPADDILVKDIILPETE